MGFKPSASQYMNNKKPIKTSNPFLELLYIFVGILIEFLTFFRDFIRNGLRKSQEFFKQHISYQAVLLLSLISFATSYYGFLSLVSDGFWLTKVLFFAVVGVIQLALVYSISQLYLREFFSRHVLKALLLLLTYLLSLFISVLFSFNFYYKIFSASEFSERNVTLQLEVVQERLEDAQSSFNSIFSSLEKLSNYSMEKSIEESTIGGTCDETKIPKPGPRSALRKFESSLFQSHLESVDELKSNVSIEIDEVKLMLTNFSPKNDNVDELESKVNKKIGAINRLFRGGEILLLPKVLANHKGAKRMEMESLGRKISCPDSKITQKINAILENLNSLTFLEKVTFFDSNDEQQLIERTINVLFAILPFTDTKVVAIDDIESPTDVTQSDVKAIGLGFLVDFFIFFFTILSKEPYRARYFREDSIVEYQKYGLRRTLKPFMFEGHFFYHMIVPNQKRNGRIDEIVTRFQLDKMISLSGSNIKYDELLRVHQNRLGNFKDLSFQVYKVNKKKYDTLLAQIDEL